MTAEDIIKWLLGGGFLAALGTLWTTRHRPQVDKNAQTTDERREAAQATKTANDALSNALDQIQEERASEREEWRREKTEMRGEIDALRTRVVSAEKSAAESAVESQESKRLVAFAVAENASLVDYVMATAQGIAERRVPPFIDPRLYGLQNRLTLADLPAIPPRDTGVPGVDINPPT